MDFLISLIPVMPLATVAAWAAVGVGVAGIGASMYGANKNAKAQAAANAANVQAQEDANRIAYEQWLMTRGVGRNGEPVNTRLPLWATAPAGFGVPKTQRRFRRASAARALAAAAPEQTYDQSY